MVDGAISVLPSIVEGKMINVDGLDTFVYVYSVLIKNDSSESVRLVSRKWYISDGNGQTKIITGEGVVGQKPLIEPKAAFEYQSYVTLPTEFGSMSGEYVFVKDSTNESFSAEIPHFYLGEELKIKKH